MATALEHSCPVVVPAACLHHNSASWEISHVGSQLAASQAFFVNSFARDIGVVELKCILGNINAQYANSSHVDLPSEVKVLQTESSLEDPARLTAWMGMGMGMVHYISTGQGARSRFPSHGCGKFSTLQEITPGAPKKRTQDIKE